ncbi:hypothetical protein GSI_02675 [Ganoderma sinense ZZ0214-1]|uniref:Uncharacterized protein n=1 Tax=Ganoderma sinense ZZ0214-1 TaxID=1077348 RepID=A0A2G8SMT5_9APHY|nr:hypothetical protein GSI_02675 [Ganoderma sinense ZZ0214-1]
MAADEDVVMGESSTETVTPGGVLEPAASLNHPTAAPTVLDTYEDWDEEEEEEGDSSLFSDFVNPRSSPPPVASPRLPPLCPSEVEHLVPPAATVKLEEYEDVGLPKLEELEPARIPVSPFRCPSRPCFTCGCPQKTPAQPTEECQWSRGATSRGTPLRGDFRIAGPNPEADRAAEPDDSEFSMSFSIETTEATSVELHFTSGDCEVSRTKGRSDAPTLPVFHWRVKVVRGGGPGSVSISAGCIWKTGDRL